MLIVVLFCFFWFSFFYFSQLTEEEKEPEQVFKRKKELRNAERRVEVEREGVEPKV